jgi:hypothetical protein
MSRVYDVEVDCPTCGEKFNAPLWESLNADLNPAEKDLLLSGNFFVTTCPKCRTEHPFIYPMLYHDMTNSVMIHLVLNEENAEDILTQLKSVEASPMMGSMSLAGYKFRFVKSHTVLREKAMIFDCGFDDRVIELLKIHHRTMFSKAHPSEKLVNIFFHKDNKSCKFIFLAKNDAIYAIDFDNAFYDEVAKTRKNVINEKSKECFYIDQEWALDLLKNDGVYNKNLPFQDVHYGSEYMGFSDGHSENICLCLCQKQSVENRIKIYMRHYQYDSCLNPQDEMLLSFLGLPKYFKDKITASRVPFGEEWLSFLQYSREICHICNSQKPDYQHSIYVHDSDFKKQWGHYMKSRYFHYGIDDMEHWGVYFIEEALSPDHRKLLCPTKEELAKEMSGFGCELDKLFALPKDQLDVLLYYRTKAEVLREKSMVAYYNLSSELGFSDEFMNELHSIIHKRFLAVRKSIRDELKRMIPKKAATPPTKKKK